jgi:hypothetical protein
MHTPQPPGTSLLAWQVVPVMQTALLDAGEVFEAFKVLSWHSCRHVNVVLEQT